MSSYPILLNLRHRRVAVIGGGRVAARKVSGLLEAEASVTVISPMLHPILVERAAKGEIDYRQEGYRSGILADLRPLLVFAVTDQPDVNQSVAQEAESLGILVNVADDSSSGNFSSMAVVQRPPITLALATDGASPALSAHLKARLERVISEDDVRFAHWLKELRPLVKECFPSQMQRERFWRTLIESNASTLLGEGDINGAYNVVQELLKEA
jgi:precorrin-2 dehydrogenase / sirohydrochlorin ferrochelatase